MSWLSWLRLRRRDRHERIVVPIAPPAVPPRPPAPPNWSVTIGGGKLAAARPDGSRQAIPLDQIHAVAIEASDLGAGRRALWWMIHGPEGDVAFVFPRGAQGEDRLVAHLTAQPGFREDSYDRAVGSRDCDTFVIWQRAGG